MRAEADVLEPCVLGHPANDVADVLPDRARHEEELLVAGVGDDGVAHERRVRHVKRDGVPEGNVAERHVTRLEAQALLPGLLVRNHLHAVADAPGRCRAQPPQAGEGALHGVLSPLHEVHAPVDIREGPVQQRQAVPVVLERLVRGRLPTRGEAVPREPRPGPGLGAAERRRELLQQRGRRPHAVAAARKDRRRIGRDGQFGDLPHLERARAERSHRGALARI
mmetsp:Transcript_3185/g.9114  ORF Transcript_3185/g.9114 Transcript_3185/m.9114 type:complete len:223 (-) Transcript_3185:499-1167(-)